MNQWLIFRILLLILVVLVLIPTIRLMRQVEKLEKAGTSDRKQKQALADKQRQLKFMQRILITLFLIALAATMLKAYLPIITKGS